jgi:hypothetical protein
MQRQIIYVSMVLLASLAIAQFQVNTQVGGRVNRELYGNNGTSGSMRYAAYQTNLLPSEARYATWKSGATRSELRMNYLATGPLAPNGAMAYIPNQSTLQRAMNMPQPQLYNPAYVKPAQVNASIAPMSTGAAGTIRYSNSASALAASPYQINAMSTAGMTTSAQLPTGQLPTGQVNAQLTGKPQGARSIGSMVLSQSSIDPGTIKYAQPKSLSPTP